MPAFSPPPPPPGQEPDLFCEFSKPCKMKNWFYFVAWHALFTYSFSNNSSQYDISQTLKVYRGVHVFCTLGSTPYCDKFGFFCTLCKLSASYLLPFRFERNSILWTPIPPSNLPLGSYMSYLGAYFGDFFCWKQLSGGCHYSWWRHTHVVLTAKIIICPDWQDPHPYGWTGVRTGSYMYLWPDRARKGYCGAGLNKSVVISSFLRGIEGY
jgi:hypothetical protein